MARKLIESYLERALEFVKRLKEDLNSDNPEEAFYKKGTFSELESFRANANNEGHLRGYLKKGFEPY